MNFEQAKAFISKVEAYTGYPVGNNDVRKVWVQYLQGVGPELAERAMQFLEDKAGDNGFTAKNRPNLSTFKGAVNHVKNHGRTAQTNSSSMSDYPDCKWCNQSGLVFVIYAGPDYDHLKIRRREDSIPWRVMAVVSVPCYCAAGDHKAELEDGCWNLSKEARRHILEHCAFAFNADAYKRIREIRGIEDKPDTDLPFAQMLEAAKDQASKEPNPF